MRLERGMATLSRLDATNFEWRPREAQAWAGLKPEDDRPARRGRTARSNAMKK
jgi:hypothetical protein